MNICQLAKTIKEKQTAYSKELNMRIYSDGNGLCWEDTTLQGQMDQALTCDLNYLLTDDWEIEVSYVDFWTAWNAAKNGAMIKYKSNSYSFDYQQLKNMSLSSEMIDGCWEIIEKRL